MRVAHQSRNASRQVTGSGDQIVVLSHDLFKAVRQACQDGATSAHEHAGLNEDALIEALACLGMSDETTWSGFGRSVDSLMERQRSDSHVEEPA